MSEKPVLNPRLILLLGVLCSSLSAPIVRAAGAPSLTTATLRLGWTILLLLFPTLLRHKEEIRGLSKKDILACFVSGFFLAIHFSSWFESLKWTTIASSTVLCSTEIIFVALGFALFLKGKIPRMGVLAIAVAFAGSVVLALYDSGAGTAGANHLLGDALATVAAVCVAVYTLIGRVKRGNMSTTVYTFFTYLSCLMTLLVLDVVTGTPLTGWPMREYLIGLALAVFCTLLGHSLFSWSLKYMTPPYVASIKLCEPVASTVIAVFLYHEIPGAVQLIGAMIILAGVLLYTQVEGKVFDRKKVPAAKSEE